MLHLLPDAPNANFHEYYTSNNDVDSTLRATLNNESSLLVKQSKATNHTIDTKIDKREVKVYRNRYDLCCAKKLCL